MLTTFVMVSLATAVISYTLTKSTLFEELRWKVQYKYYEERVETDPVTILKHKEKRETKLAQFVSCPFCVSHWIALVLVVLVDVRVLGTTGGFSLHLVLDYLVAAFACVAVATFAGAVIHRAYNPPVTYYKKLED